MNPSKTVREYSGRLERVEIKMQGYKTKREQRQMSIK